MVPGAGIERMVKSLVLYDKNISNKFMYPQKYPQLILLLTRAAISFFAARDTPPPGSPAIIFWSPTIPYTFESI